MAGGGSTADSGNYVCPHLANHEEATRLLKVESERLKAEFAIQKSENDILMNNISGLQARHESQIRAIAGLKTRHASQERAMAKIDKRFAEAQGEFVTLMKKACDLQKNVGIKACINESVGCKNEVQRIMAVMDELSTKWMKISTEMADTKLRANESMENIDSDLRAQKEMRESIQHQTGKLKELEQRHQKILDASYACAGTGPCDLCKGSDVNL